jgi:hypothetical protein
MQYSTEQLIKEVENSIAEVKQYNQDYDVVEGLSIMPLFLLCCRLGS